MAPLPQKVGVATLHYKCPGDEVWIQLEGCPGVKHGNVANVVFHFNIKIEQRFKLGAAICTLNLAPQHYRDVKLSADEEKSRTIPDFLVEFSVDQGNIPPCTLTRTMPGTDDMHELSEFPLHNVSTKISALKLRLPHDFCKPGDGRFKVMERLRVMTHGDTASLQGTPEQLYIQKLMEGQIKESDAAAASLKTLAGCRIVAKMNVKKMFVGIWPNQLADKIDEKADFDKKGLSMYYTITSSSKFTVVKAKEHPVFGDPECKQWRITLENHSFPGNPPLVGTIDNVFKPEQDSKAFEGEEFGVILEPGFLDAGGDRARASLNQYRTLCNDEAAMYMGFFNAKAKFSLLPIREMFLPKMPFRKDLNVLAGQHRPIPDEWRNTLNESQCQGIKICLEKKASIIWGPAATGKSQTLSRAIRMLILNDPREQIVVCSPTNEGVNNLAERAVRGWAKCKGPNEADARFVRIYSNSEIDVQLRARNQALYEDPMHIDKQRCNIAERHPGKYSGYLKGRSELILSKDINESKAYIAYCSQRNLLTAMVLQNAQVVFVTCNSLRGRALLALKKKTKGQKEKAEKEEEEEEFEPWPATSCIVDEAGCANPLQLLMPLTTFSKTLKRVTFAGDHLQLPPFTSTEEVLKYWPQSPLRDLYERGIDCTQLNTQYRAHEALFEPANRIIYEGKVKSAYKTENPSAFLGNLKRLLPKTFYAGEKMGRLLNYSNFIDVSHGKQETKKEGSSCNPAEVEVIEGMITLLLSLNCPASSIAILTGYLWQLELLEKMVRSHGQSWADVKVLNADKCQGREYDIVIVSLVKTEGSPGFLGNKFRANVITTRAKEARYLVGKWAFWFRGTNPRSNYETMHDLIRWMYNSQQVPFLSIMKLKN